MALSLDSEAHGLRPLSRQEFDALTRRGVLDDARVELLYGRLVSMSPQGEAHSYGVTELARILVPAVGQRARVRIQMPLAVSDTSEPEPDVAVVAPGTYLDQHPSTAWLVIEVADSSLERDRGKATLYAAAGVLEYWIVNLNEGVFEVYDRPTRDGFGRLTRHARGAMLHLPGLADVVLGVSEVLPPRR